MSYFSSIEHVMGYEEKVRKGKERSDPFVEHLRQVLPRDPWEVFK